MFNNLRNGKRRVNAKINNALSANVGATPTVRTVGKVIFCLTFRFIFLFFLITGADPPLPRNLRKKYLKLCQKIQKISILEIPEKPGSLF